MDPILAALPGPLLSFIEDQLSNNEVSSDEELLDHFIANGLTRDQAQQALTYRQRYLINIYHIGFSPIRNPGLVLRFNPHVRDFEPE